MTKRIVSLALAALLFIGICAPAASAASGTAARAVVGRTADGQYTLGMRSDLTSSDKTHSYYYTDNFFSSPATQYNHSLAKASLGLALAAYSTFESEKYYWADGDVGREKHLADAYDTLGFADARFYNYDISLNLYEDYAAYGIARKTLNVGGKRRTIVAVALRGGGYGCEWSSNINLGTAAVHEGFAKAADEAMASLEQYIADAKKKGDLGEVKIWICGYSRAGAVANLMAGLIASGMPELKKENVYVYTVAAPASLTANGADEYKADYANNYKADGTLKNTWDASNVWNIIGSGDLVPALAPEDWGYRRNGSDRYLPVAKTEAEVEALNAIAAQVDGEEKLDFAKLGGKEETSLIISSFEKTFTDRDTYCLKYQQALEDMTECAFQLSEAEVNGRVLNNDEIYERISSLGGMGKFSWDEKVKNILLASNMSRPLLERYGKNVPLRVQQALIPLLATGLCYKVESNVLQLVAQYVSDILAANVAPQQSVSVAVCHFPEVYIALMEYYSPENHLMQADTKPATGKRQQAL